MSADRTSLAVCVDVLGPLQLRVDGTEVTVPGLRRRALLALLALDAGRTVGAERLVDSLWPEDPPANAVQALYNHVSRLRGHLGGLARRLERQGAGYRLHLEPDELDVDAVRRLAGRVADPATPPTAAVDLATTALQMWRGSALGEFRSLPALEAASVGLDELRLRLTDDVVEARLALGDRTVAAEAAAHAAETPLRERTLLLHVRALAAEGRAAEAMEVAHRFRSRLAEDSGLDPSPAVAELEHEVASGAAARHAGSLLSLAAPAPRVTRPAGPMVGRDHDRAEVLRLLATHAAVTVTGPGGVGKTRLALDVAADPTASPAASGDAVVADLAAVDAPERVCQAVASTLGLRTAGQVRPEDVAAALAGRELLLVLDNCEHVSDACRDLVQSLRRAAPGVRVLATSRVTLQVPGEYVVRLQPLPVPRDITDVTALRRQPAVRALIEHARRRRSDFDVDPADTADLVEVLRRVDGLPLGIELAARQVAVMPLRAVRDRLHRALDLATGRPGADDDRQRTLRASIDSSYRLLGEDDGRLLRALAPFPAGVDLATVEALAQDLGTLDDPVDQLHRLVDASLLVVEPASGRYRLLVTVRAFLIDDLRARGEQNATHRRFLDRCLAVARELGGDMFGPDEPAHDARLRAELGNLRAARDLARTEGRHDVRVEITLCLDEPSIWRDLREVWCWSFELAADPELAGHPDRPGVLGCAAEAARLLGDLDGAVAYAEEALELGGADPEPRQVNRAWRALGSVAHFRGDFAAAEELWLRSGEGRPVISGGFVGSAALAAAYAGEPGRARELLDRAHAMIAESLCVSHAAFASYVEGELRATEHVEDAVPLYLEAIEGAQRAGANFVVGIASVALASARTRIGDVPGAAEGFCYLLGYWRRTGQVTQLWTTARNAAGLLASAGHVETAALLLICADDTPGAAAVDPRIARFSGRAYTPVAGLVDDDTRTRLHAEAARIRPSGVLDRAVSELARLAE